MFSSFLQSQTAQLVLHATVRDSQGKPVAGATLRLQARNGSNALTGLTDAQGSYDFSAPTPGVYTLHAEMKERGEATISSILIRANEPKKTVELVLSAPALAFYDSPQFTVSGVTDTTSLGGHGSDTVVRTLDTLAKETADLANPPASKPSTATQQTLREQAQRTQDLLEHHETAELHHLLADIYEKLGNSLSAVHEYQRAAELSPSEPYLFDWGAELLLHHAPEPALEVFRSANHRFPKSMRILIGLGTASYALGSYDQAVQRICEASDLNPRDPKPYLFLGKMDRTGSLKSDVLVIHLRRFTTLHPENAAANYYYAAALWKRRNAQQSANEFSQIESLLKKAVTLDPHLGTAYLQLGILHSEQRDLSQAISDYDHAIQADPQLEESHYRLAQAYRQTGDSEKAKAEIEIYDQMSKASAQQADRERREIRQFVYTLRDQPSPQTP